MADPFDYMKQATKPSKIAKTQQKRQNINNIKGERS